MFSPEDGGTMSLRNISTFLPGNEVYHPGVYVTFQLAGRLEYRHTYTQLWFPQTTSIVADYLAVMNC
jgi:hypothetical protein